MRELAAALRLAEYSGEAVLSEVAASTAASCIFVVPEEVRELKFADLPGSTRLEALIRKMGLRQLGDLHGRDADDLLRCSNIGVGTIVELQRLIARAAQGEFNGKPVSRSAAPAALLSLIEAGLTTLPPRDRDLLLDRIGARGTAPATLEQLSREHRLTRERVRQIVERALVKLSKAWGPRIPALLGMLKMRCNSNLCPLTSTLLGHWIGAVEASLRLTTDAHLRLISALDRTVPCWPLARSTPTDIEISQPFYLTLRTIVFRGGDAGIRMSEAYGRVKAQEDFRELSFAQLLQMLAKMPDIAVSLEQPEVPVLSLRRSSPSETFAARIESIICPKERRHHRPVKTAA
jgi:hypothetical protein